MRKGSLRLGQALLCLFMLPFLPVQAARKPRLHISGGTLLLGAGSDLYLTNDGGEFGVTPPNPTNGGHPISSSLSTDGNLVATSYVKVPYPRNAPIPTAEKLAQYKEGIAVYFVRERLWRLHGEFHNVWEVAIGPDNSRIAVLTQDSWESPYALSLLNLTTGGITTLVAKFSGGSIRWAPDGIRLVY